VTPPTPAPPKVTPPEHAAAPKVQVPAVPRPRPPRPPRTVASNSGDDVFESETKLGNTGAAAAPPAAGGGTCSVTLGSKPWSQVWIDGKDTGKVTPLVDYKVACGKHKVTFKNPEIPVEKSESITVKSGEKFKKVVPLVDTGE
jgi:hypothetical protein